MLKADDADLACCCFGCQRRVKRRVKLILNRGRPYHYRYYQIDIRDTPWFGRRHFTAQIAYHLFSIKLITFRPIIYTGFDCGTDIENHM
jgi:hypothetical protein